jgi:DNA helicase-2/ATP-dependent DNA helicase PcrA
VIVAENRARRHLDYAMDGRERRLLDRFTEQDGSLLVLTHHNQTARSLRPFFARRLPLWEGHTRTALETLVRELEAGNGRGIALATAVAAFMAEIGKGCGPSAFGNALVKEVTEGCVTPRRGTPAKIQAIAQCLVDDPSHRGVARCLARISELVKTDPAFGNVAIDNPSELREAIRLGDYESADEGMAEIAHRRTYSRPQPAGKAISTIHKAKGLECDRVAIMPCDAKTFPANRESRCLLYVALSRAKKNLMLVVSRDNPSPLLTI